jgi:predicted dehydrogenase
VTARGERGLRLGILGRDAHADALFALTRPDHVAPRGRADVAAWWPGSAQDLPDGAGSTSCSEAAAVLADGAVDLVFLAAPAARDPELVAQVAASGIGAVAFLPVAAPPANAGGLRVTSELRTSLAGAHALAALARGDVGRPMAVYHGVRAPGTAGEPGRVLRRVLWEALDLLLEIVGDAPTRVFYRASNLMGGDHDHLHVLLRFADDTIATLDLLELPPSGGEPDIDVEVTGSEGLLRLRPQLHQITVADHGREPVVRRTGWHPEPVRLLLDHLLAAGPTPAELAPAWSPRLGALAETLEVRRAAASEGVFEP